MCTHYLPDYDTRQVNVVVALQCLAITAGHPGDTRRFLGALSAHEVSVCSANTDVPVGLDTHPIGRAKERFAKIRLP